MKVFEIQVGSTDPEERNYRRTVYGKAKAMPEAIVAALRVVKKSCEVAEPKVVAASEVADLEF